MSFWRIIGRIDFWNVEMNFSLSILGMNAVEALAGNAHIRYFIFHLVYTLSCAYSLYSRRHLLESPFNNPRKWKRTHYYFYCLYLLMQFSLQLLETQIETQIEMVIDTN